MHDPVHRYLPLRHRLQQAGLGLGRSPVDLIRQQHLRLFQKASGYGNPLLFASREIDTILCRGDFSRIPRSSVWGIEPGQRLLVQPVGHHQSGDSLQIQYGSGDHIRRLRIQG